MSREKKISDKQLKQELVENGKTQKQIAYEYGFSYPSSQLSKQINELGVDTRQRKKISQHQHSGGIIRLTRSTLQKAGVDLDDQDWFYETEIKKGEIVIKPKKQQYSVANEDDE